jgi:uncharacterized protein YbjT (DUF2867 family)
MILITGATGHIGHELVRLLRDKGADFRVLIPGEAGAAELQQIGVEVVSSDFDDVKRLAGVMKKAERLFLASAPDPEQATKQGLLVKAAQKAHISHLVKLSSQGAASDAPCRLARWHAQTEQQIESSGLDSTILRPHYVMQNMLMFEHTITIENAFYAPMGEGRVSMVDARDIAAVAATVLLEDGHAGRAYEITGPEALSFEDVANKLSAIRKRQVTYVDIPPERAREGMLRAGTPDWLADAILELYAGYRIGTGELVTDVVERLTDQRPRSFDEFAVDYAEHFSRRKTDLG